MIKLTTILYEGFFDVAPGISVKDLFKFYNRVSEHTAEEVSKLIHRGEYQKARQIIQKVLSKK